MIHPKKRKNRIIMIITLLIGYVITRIFLIRNYHLPRGPDSPSDLIPGIREIQLLFV